MGNKEGGPDGVRQAEVGGGGGGASAVALGVGFLTLHAKLEVPLINSVSRLAQPEVLDWVAVELGREV